MPVVGKGDGTGTLGEDVSRGQKREFLVLLVPDHFSEDPLVPARIPPEPRPPGTTRPSLAQ
jgi:hypothetical protein